MEDPKNQLVAAIQFVMSPPQGTHPEAVQTTLGQLNAILEQPNAVSILLELAGYPDGRVATFATVNLVRIIKNIPEEHRGPFADPLQAILRGGVDNNTKFSIVEVLFPIVANFADTTALVPLACELFSMENNKIIGTYLFASILPDFRADDGRLNEVLSKVPPEVLAAFFGYIPELLQNTEDESATEAAHCFITDIAMMEEDVSAYFPVAQWIAGVGQILIARLTAAIQGQNSADVSKFAEFIHGILEDAEPDSSFVQMFTQLPEMCATVLMSGGAEYLVEQALISIIESFAVCTPDIIFANIDGHIQALLQFVRNKYVADPTCDEYRGAVSTFACIAERMCADLDETDETFQCFGKYIAGLMEARDEVSFMCAMTMIEAVYEPLAESFDVNFEAVENMLRMGLDPSLGIANPRTVETCAVVICTIVRFSPTRAVDVVEKFQPIMMNYLKSNDVLEALAEMWHHSDDTLSFDVRACVQALLTEVQQTNPDDYWHLEKIFGAISYLVYMSEDEDGLDPSVYPVLIPLGVSVLQKHGDNAPATIQCFASLAYMNPQAMRGALDDLMKVLGAVLGSTDPEIIGASLRFVCALVDIYVETMKGVAREFFGKALEIFMRVLQDDTECETEEEYETLEEQNQSIINWSLAAMTTIIQRYPDLITDEEVASTDKCFQALMSHESGMACKDIYSSSISGFVTALAIRNHHDPAAKWLSVMLEFTVQVDDVDQLRNVWEEICKAGWAAGPAVLSKVAPQFFETFKGIFTKGKSIYWCGKGQRMFEPKLINKIMDAIICVFTNLGEAVPVELAGATAQWLNERYQASQKGKGKGPIVYAHAVVATKVPALLPQFFEELTRRALEQIGSKMEENVTAAYDALSNLIEAQPGPILSAFGPQILQAAVTSMSKPCASRNSALGLFCAIHTSLGQPLTGEVVQQAFSVPAEEAGIIHHFITKFMLMVFQQDDLRADSNVVDAVIDHCVTIFAEQEFVYNVIPLDQKQMIAGILTSTDPAVIQKYAQYHEGMMMNIQRHIQMAQAGV